MRLKIGIVGGGHIGSVLGLALLAEGYDATIVTEFTPEQLRRGRVLSSQCTWGMASAIEARWAPAFWRNDYAGIGGFQVRVADRHDGAIQSDITAALERNGNSVDQRLKVSFWIEEFQRRGGALAFGKVSGADLESLSEKFDLTIVCAGKFRGDLGDLFPRDADRSRYDRAQRIGAVVFLSGRTQPLSNATTGAFEEWSVVPDIGDFFAIPAFAQDGPCHVICMEGFVGGPLDLFNGVKDPDEILRLTRQIFERWLPWERGRWDNAKLIDQGAAICGGFAPTVRHPIAQLANGKRIMAFADAHVLIDPLTAQGANTHLKNIPFLLDRIRDAAGAFTADWMKATTDGIWQRAKGVDAVQEQYLNPRPHLWSLFRAAHDSPRFAHWWVNAHFDQPLELLPWIEDGRAMADFTRQFSAVAAAHR